VRNFIFSGPNMATEPSVLAGAPLDCGELSVATVPCPRQQIGKLLLIYEGNATLNSECRFGVTNITQRSWFVQPRCPELFRE
jgi:hypothetical protein